MATTTLYPPPWNTTPSVGVVWTSATQTWTSGGGQSVTFTVPATVRGQTVSRLMVTGMSIRVLTGTTGNNGTFGFTVAGNNFFSLRHMPTYGGGVDVSFVSVDVGSISSSGSTAGPGDTIVTASGGTLTTSITVQVDVIGYYPGITG